MNTHVKFSTAKMLKEKGYFYITPKYYTTENPHSFHKDLDGICILGLLHSKTLYQEYTERDEESGLLLYQLDPSVVHAPTIAEVVMWLYEKHGIWIEVRKHTRDMLLSFIPYIDNKPINSDVFFNDYDSPTEAYEAAIEYTLKNIL